MSIRINNRLINNYQVSFGGYNYYVDAIDSEHAKAKVYNKIKKTEPTFLGDSMVNSCDIKVWELFK